MKINVSFPLILLFLFVSSVSWAQTDKLSLEKIYTQGEFQTRGFGPVRWLEDGSGYTTLSPQKLLMAGI